MLADVLPKCRSGPVWPTFTPGYAMLMVCIHVNHHAE